MPGYAAVELKPLGKGEFTAPAINRRFVFNRNGDGSVNSVTVHPTSKHADTTPAVALKV